MLSFLLAVLHVDGLRYLPHLAGGGKNNKDFKSVMQGRCLYAMTGNTRACHCLYSYFHFERYLSGYMHYRSVLLFRIAQIQMQSPLAFNWPLKSFLLIEC